MARPSSPFDARLAVLGQIAVLRDRIDKLEDALLRKPLGGGDYWPLDEAGNVSLQAGALVGALSNYQEAIANEEKAN